MWLKFIPLLFLHLLPLWSCLCPWHGWHQLSCHSAPPMGEDGELRENKVRSMATQLLAKFEENSSTAQTRSKVRNGLFKYFISQGPFPFRPLTSSPFLSFPFISFPPSPFSSHLYLLTSGWGPIWSILLSSWVSFHHPAHSFRWGGWRGRGGEGGERKPSFCKAQRRPPSSSSSSFLFSASRPPKVAGMLPSEQSLFLKNLFLY